MLQLHAVCNTLKARILDAGLRVQQAQGKLTFHVQMAAEKGVRNDFRHWVEPVNVLQGMAVLGDKLSADLQAMEDAGYSLPWHKSPPATSEQVLATLPSSVLATLPSSADAISLPQQWGHTGNLLSGARPSGVDRLVTNPQAAAQLTSSRAARQASPSAVGLVADKATLADVLPAAASGSMVDSQIISTPEAGAAGLDDLPMERRPAHTAAQPAALPPNRIVSQLMGGDHPRSLAWSGFVAAPKVMFAPADIEGTYTILEDPNLILWDPDENVAVWMDPVLYFRRSLLLDMAAVYPTAGLPFETDCDEQGVTLDHTGRAAASQHILADLGDNSLPPFAVAGVLGILVQAVLHDLAWKEHQKSGSQSGSQPGASPTIWGRRLVFHRHLATDCLLGCVQICRHRADQIPGPLAKLLRKLPRNTLRVGTPGRSKGMNQSDMQHAHNEPPATDRPSTFSTSPTDFTAPLQAGQFHLKLLADQTLEEYAHSMRDLLAPEQSAKIAKIPVNPARGRQDQEPNSPGPTKSPHDDGQISKASSDGNMEVARKLRDAQQQLERRLGSSSKAEQDRSDRDLLKREKKEDRTRAAWAKLGKEPPPPKASKPNVKVDCITSSPPDVPIKPNDSVKQALPTYASSQETLPGPTADESSSGSISKATTEPAATPAGTITRPQATAAGMSSGNSSQPAGSTASESKSADQPHPAASKHASAQGCTAVQRADDAVTITQPAAPSDEVADAEQATSNAESRSENLLIVLQDPDSDQDEAGHADADDDEDEDDETYNAAAAAEEEAEAASEARQLFEQSTKQARAAAAKAAAEDKLREARARQDLLKRETKEKLERLERNKKETEALNNATKLLK